MATEGGKNVPSSRQFQLSPSRDLSRRHHLIQIKFASPISLLLASASRIARKPHGERATDSLVSPVRRALSISKSNERWETACRR